MHFPRLHCLLFIALTVLSRLHGSEALVTIGADYNEVIQTLGKPDGDISAGSKRILTYGDAKITLRADKVTAISAGLDSKLQARNKNLESLAAKRSAGLVNYKGEWMQPAQRDAFIHAENNDKKQAAAQRASKAINSAGWHTNFKQVVSLARAQNKKILINFTGSDWCGWCIKLDKEVFSQPQFTQYAEGYYILLKCDFPQRIQLPQALQDQNTSLAKKYGVRGFPTVVVLNPDGTLYSKGGYIEGGPSAFLSSIR